MLQISSCVVVCNFGVCKNFVWYVLDGGEIWWYNGGMKLLCRILGHKPVLYCYREAYQAFRLWRHCKEPGVAVEARCERCGAMGYFGRYGFVVGEYRVVER